jgi:hypothetical protein
MTTTPGRALILSMRMLAAAATAAAGLAIAGCSESAGPPTPAPEPTAQPAPTVEVAPATVTWTDSVCSALVPVVQAVTAPPSSDLSDPAAVKQAYLSYLDGALSKTANAEQQVNHAGAAPVQGGDELARGVQQQLGDLRQDLEQARAQIERADPGDPAGFGQAVAGAGNIVGSLGNSAQAVAEVSRDPQLDTAFEQAPACAPLRAIRPPR